MLNCSEEYNETIQLSSVLYSYSTCSHGDKYGIRNLCHTACSFDVTNSNIGSSYKHSFIKAEINLPQT